MGNWNISIRGIGAHHNGKPYDADQIAAVFVDTLIALGHTITGAEITHGGSTDLAKGTRSASLKKADPKQP